MAIPPRNKNLTKQLNSYSYVIAITLQGLLQRTKRVLEDLDPKEVEVEIYIYIYKLPLFYHI